MRNAFRRPGVVLVAAFFALVALNVFAGPGGKTAQAAGDAAAPAVVTAAAHDHGHAAAEAKKGCECECCKAGCKDGCDCCKKGCPGGKDCPCAQKHGGKGKHSMKEGMKEGMKAHMGDVRKKVDALKELEKKMEGITDAAEFRKAAMQHFRMSTDIQESHLKHMESMTGGAGHGQMHKCQGHQESCKDCPKK